MAAVDGPRPGPPVPGARVGAPLAESLHWRRFRASFVEAVTPGVPPGRGAGVDRAAVARAFWAWVAVLERDAPFEALDPVDYAHFAAGQLLARLLAQRPVIVPALPVELEARALADAVIDHLSQWRRALGAPAAERLHADTTSPVWASFLENTATEPELAVAFLDEFTGREPVWRYPQLISERPAMRRARQAGRGGDPTAG